MTFAVIYPPGTLLRPAMPACRSGQLRFVETWPCSVGMMHDRDGDCPQIGGIVHCIEGDMQTGLSGLPTMLHLAGRAIRAGSLRCDCFEHNEHREPTGRRPR